MISKTAFATLLLLGLAALCSAQPDPADCRIFFGKTGSYDTIYYDGNNNVAPFTGWNTLDHNEPWAEQFTFSSLNFAEAEACDLCVLTVYSTNSFGGQSETYDAMQTPYQMQFPFCVKSYLLDCESGGGNPPEEEGVEEEMEEEGFEFELTEWTPQLIELRDYGVPNVISRLIWDTEIPSGQYDIVEGHIYNTVEVSTASGDLWQFNIIVKDQQNNEWIIRFHLGYAPPTHDIYWYQGIPN